MSPTCVTALTQCGGGLKGGRKTFWPVSRSTEESQSRRGTAVSWNWANWTFFTADILTCHTRKSTGKTYNINDGSILFKGLSAPWLCHSETAWTMQDLDIQTSRWYPFVIHFRIYTFCFAVLKCQECLLWESPSLFLHCWSHYNSSTHFHQGSKRKASVQAQGIHLLAL